MVKYGSCISVIDCIPLELGMTQIVNPDLNVIVPGMKKEGKIHCLILEQ